VWCRIWLLPSTMAASWLWRAVIVSILLQLVGGQDAATGGPRIFVQQQPGKENTTIIVHVVNDTPIAPPTPPSATLAAASGINPGMLGASVLQPGMGGMLGAFPGILQAGGAGAGFMMQGPGGMILTPAADLMGGQNLQPQPLSVTTPAADLLPTSSITALTSALRNDPLGTFSMQTVPGVRIISENEADGNCGCPNACNNPCKRNAADQIEQALDGVKSEIVTLAQKVQQETKWVKTVQDVMKHYTEKITRVQGHTSQMKNRIKRLFSKKKHFEDLQLQHQIDQEKFKKAAQKEKWNDPAPNGDAGGGGQGRGQGLGDCEPDCCDKDRDQQKSCAGCSCGQ